VPAEYVKKRDELMSQGVAPAEAKKRAAKWYNGVYLKRKRNQGKKAVGPGYEKY